jgi:hypothetical protein
MSARAFRIVQVGSERVHAPQLVAIALGCLCVGVALTQVVTRVAPSSRLREARFAESAMFAASDPSLAEDGVSHAPAAAVVAPVPTASARPGRGSHRRHSSHHRFHAGGVVYAGCDGAAASNHGHSACPHDRALEAAVWRTLKRLTSCYTATPDHGHAELHLTVHRNRPLEIALAAPARGRSLNLRAVGRCAVPRLSKLRSHRKLDRARITFRFGLS